mmetsp:Transcript_45885/g.121691  ORF Transcript_45885/g.121691 Transcript_45885/m.121691 type:complete len:217 (+) Transcript_45885:895-1545(+)
MNRPNAHVEFVIPRYWNETTEPLEHPVPFDDFLLVEQTAVNLRHMTVEGGVSERELGTRGVVRHRHSRIHGTIATTFHDEWSALERAPMPASCGPTRCDGTRVLHRSLCAGRKDAHHPRHQGYIEHDADVRDAKTNAFQSACMVCRNQEVQVFSYVAVTVVYQVPKRKLQRLRDPEDVARAMEPKFWRNVWTPDIEVTDGEGVVVSHRCRRRRRRM